MLSQCKASADSLACAWQFRPAACLPQCQQLDLQRVADFWSVAGSLWSWTGWQRNVLANRFSLVTFQSRVQRSNGVKSFAEKKNSVWCWNFYCLHQLQFFSVTITAVGWEIGASAWQWGFQEMGGGAVANRLRRRTSDQTVLGSNPAVAAALSPWTRLFTPIVPRRSLHISFY